MLLTWPRNAEIIRGQGKDTPTRTAQFDASSSVLMPTSRVLANASVCCGQRYFAAAETWLAYIDKSFGVAE